MASTSNAKQIVKTIVPPQYHWTLRVWAARATHLGTQRYCPCCDSHLSGFGSFGERPRPDALCPVCGSLERHRLATMFLRMRPDLLSELRRVLHVAPEAPIAQILQGAASESYLSVDLCAEGAMVCADLTQLPFASNSFGAIFCSHVLEHVPEDHKAMAELHRVLRPGGWVLVQVPVQGDTTFEDPDVTDPETRRRLFGQPDHVRVYGRDVADRLARARFSVSVEQPQRGFDRGIIARCGLKALEDIFLCTKVR